jgi:polyphosphate kinase 2 (PPK2 family)
MKTIAQILKNKISLGNLGDKELKKLQLKIEELQQAAWLTGQRTVIVLEGFDAAGKGGAIRALTARLDPRSCTVVPVSAPTSEEKGQHYLQRFWKRLPTSGHMVIFDRSWYGRVLVEKVEGFAPKERIEAAYREINQFEKMLKDDGILVIKIFLVVSKKEQLKRFRERLENPLKNWKITEEDVRNRKKWDAYVKVADVMVKRCPGWTLVPSDDKDCARAMVMKTVVDGMKKKIKIPARSKELNKLAKELLKL